MLTQLLTVAAMWLVVWVAWPTATTTKQRTLLILASLFAPSWLVLVPLGLRARYRDSAALRTVNESRAQLEAERQRELDITWWRDKLLTGTPMQQLNAADILTYWEVPLVAPPDPPVQAERRDRPPEGWVWREDAPSWRRQTDAAVVRLHNGKLRVAVKLDDADDESLEDFKRAMGEIMARPSALAVPVLAEPGEQKPTVELSQEILRALGMPPPTLGKVHGHQLGQDKYLGFGEWGTRRHPHP